MEHGGVRRNPQSSSTLNPRFNQGLGELVSYWMNLFANGVMDYTRYPISELHLGKFPDSLEFQLQD